MSSQSIRLTYRPIRVGWCLERGDFVGFRRAVRTNFTWWGGRFNPLIPVDDEVTAQRLCDLFHVDVLVGASQTLAVGAFISKQKHLGWFERHQRLVIDRGPQGRVSAIADILEPMNRIYTEHYRSNPQADPMLAMHRWQDDDPLANILLTSFGGLPAAEETAEDYHTFLLLNLRGQGVEILPDQPVPLTHPGLMSLAQLNRLYIDRNSRGVAHWRKPGVYIGEAGSFDDLLNYWNLRAADVPLIFYDPAHAGRLDPFRDNWCSAIRANPPWLNAPSDGLSIIHARGRDPGDLAAFDDNIVLTAIGPETWNGLNVRVPLMSFGSANTLVSVDREGNRPSISFSLPDRPVSTASAFDEQAYIVSVDTGFGLILDEQFTLHLPHVPALNMFYGDSIYYPREAIRSEPGSLGVVVSASRRHLSLRAIETNRLFAAIFGNFGIAATPSSAGLVCTRLVRQMGGLDRCRVFRIGGVRTLIESYDPDQSFTMSDAMRTIFGENGPHPLEKYQGLFIEPRPLGRKLSNSAVFAHLLGKELFRPGLKLDCPNCRLDFWRSLDEVSTRTACEYCGHIFNIGPQLKDRNWAFRRSGLFGRKDNQEGAIPVALTLQQLSNIYSMDPQLYATATKLEPNGADIAPCETDFIFFAPQGHDSRVQIAIGECKTRGAIDAKDVENLLRVANAFPRAQFDIFLVFAKLCDFDEAELAVIARANEGSEHRVILMTERELEPWSIYERTEEIFDIRNVSISLSDLAEATHDIFFEKRLKSPPADSGVSNAV